jgi:hypothetical protein
MLLPYDSAGVASGLLRAEGQRRSRRYRAGKALYERVGAALGIEAVGPEQAARPTIVAALTARLAQLPE